MAVTNGFNGVNHSKFTFKLGCPILNTLLVINY